MKKIIFSSTISLALLACGNTSESVPTADSNRSTPVSETSSIETEQQTGGAAKSHKETYIDVTIKGGPIEGSYRFVPNKGDFISQINLEVYEGVSKMSGQALISKDHPGLILEFFTRPFEGAPSVGAHDAHHYTTDCGLLKFRSEGENYDFKHIRGQYKNCTNTMVKDIAPWKDGVVKRRRGVLASFSDAYEVEITAKDDQVTTATMEVEITVNAIQSEML